MSASVSSRVLLEVSSTTGCVRASTVPSSGIEIWKSESTSSSIASNSWSVLSISSISSTTGSLGGDRGHQRALEQELLAEDVVLHVVPAGALALGLDAQQLLAVVPLVQRLGLVQALVALQADQSRPRYFASALASSVLPTPAGPSTRIGLPSLAAR